LPADRTAADSSAANSRSTPHGSSTAGRYSVVAVDAVRVRAGVAAPVSSVHVCARVSALVAGSLVPAGAGAPAMRTIGVFSAGGAACPTAATRIRIGNHGDGGQAQHGD
jgi:hypothetical protein